MRFTFDMQGWKQTSNNTKKTSSLRDKIQTGSSPTSVTTDIRSPTNSLHQPSTNMGPTAAAAAATTTKSNGRTRTRGSKKTSTASASASTSTAASTASHSYANMNHHYPTDQYSSQYLAHVKQEQDEHSMSSISSISEASLDKDGSTSHHFDPQPHHRAGAGRRHAPRGRSSTHGNHDTYREQLDAMMISTSSPYSIIEELHREEVKRNRTQQQQHQHQLHHHHHKRRNGTSSSSSSSYINSVTSPTSVIESSKKSTTTITAKTTTKAATTGAGTGSQREYVIPSFDLPEEAAWTIQGIATEVTGTTGTDTATEDEEGGGPSSIYTGYTDGTGTTRKHKNGVIAMMQKSLKDKYHPSNKIENDKRGGMTRGNVVGITGGGGGGSDELVNLALVLPRNLDIQQQQQQQQQQQHQGQDGHSRERAFVTVTKLKGPGTGTVTGCGNISVVGSTASSATSVDRSMALSHIIDLRSQASSHGRRELEDAGYLQGVEGQDSHLGKLFLNFFHCCNIEIDNEEDGGDLLGRDIMGGGEDQGEDNDEDEDDGDILNRRK